MTASDDSREELARERTAWAEDRTILANERTVSAWNRTGLASLGVALGFQALFRSTEPTWVAQLGASVFIVAALVLLWSAYSSACKVLHRLNSHDASPSSRRRLLLTTALLTLGALIQLAALWAL